MTHLICLAQLHCTVGDLPGNAEKICAAAAQAHAQGACVLITPQLALSGPACRDLFLSPAFLDACDAALQSIAQASTQWPGLTLLVGHPLRRGDALHNAASVLRDGRVLGSHIQQYPDRAGDGARYFAPGQDSGVLELPGGLRIGVLIGADACHHAPARAAGGAQVLAVLDAAPFACGAPAARQTQLANCARQSRLPLLCARPVGAADALVFDGHSLALQADGALAARAPGFVAAHTLVQLDVQAPAATLAGTVAPLLEETHQRWAALVLALRDYVAHNHFHGVVLGLSGGIDSALVLALAVDALGADKVHTLMMPSPYTADISVHDAHAMAARLRVRHDTIPIAPLFDAFRSALAPAFAGRAEDSTEENLQARIRATLLMGIANKFGYLLLATGNKSESAVGYSTLYGDMAGGLAPIQDLFKTEVFALARWRNAHDPFGGGAQPIPERIITRPPSAELRAGQSDQDSLPPYEVLDAIVRLRMDGEGNVHTIAAASGASQQTVRHVLHLMQASEHKRHQAPPGVRVSRRSFTADWHQPITSGWVV